MNMRTWIIFAVATIAILAGLVVFSKQNTLNVDNVEKFTPFKTQEQVDANKSGMPDKIYGNDSAKVILIEYGDYSCPGCATLNSSLKSALDRHKEDVMLVFRHFPITSIHPNSKLAAAYAEAASLQGKFWELHDIFFSKQREWVAAPADERVELFNGYARQAGLDIDRLQKDIESNNVTQKVNFDQALGRATDVTSTPTIFLNGKQLSSAQLNDEASIEATIKDALQKQANKK